MIVMKVGEGDGVNGSIIKLTIEKIDKVFRQAINPQIGQEALRW